MSDEEILRALLTEAVENYTSHQSWRCAYPPDYYLAGKSREGGYEGCPCGLDEFHSRCAKLGIKEAEEND